jgi:GMP synthase-like glutamine amidotransferase
MKVLTVIQHTSAEYLGLMEDHFEGRQIRFKYCRPFTEGVEPPDPDAIADGLVLLGGGPWGSAGSRDVPTLDKEIILARHCLEHDKPIIGIGLGAQILAIAAGGTSLPAELVFEVGQARRAEIQALNGYLPEQYPLVSYRRDRAEPPAEAKILAVDESDRPALFQIGERAFGFAGHPGIKPAMVEDLMMEFDESPENIAAGLEKLRGIRVELEDALVSIMTGLTQLTALMRP